MNNPSAIIHGEQRAILGADLTDAQVASGVFMCSSGVDPLQLLNSAKKSDDEQLKLAYQMAMPQIGRDRMLHLSQRLERLTEALQNMMGLFDNAVYRQRLADDTMYAEAIKLARAELAVAATKPSVEPDVLMRK
jgi:hypothetical protein